MTGLDKPRYLTPAKMEQLMEEQLLSAGSMPTKDQPDVDIEAFLEAHLRVKIDQHAMLPSDELGVTTFEIGQAPFVEINKDLTGAADEGGSTSVIGRWRMTLAHEGAHVILHREAMERPLQQSSLFPPTEAAASSAQQRCLKRDLCSPRVNPWEYQANAGMAALLMPRRIFAEVAMPMFSSPKVANCRLDDPRLRLIIDELASLFCVSRTATRIRLQTLGIQSLSLQTELGL